MQYKGVLMSKLSAVSMGSAVVNLCAGREGSLGVVHSVFKKAVNVIGPDGRLISFSVRGTPNFPSNVITDCPAEVSLQGLGIVPGQVAHYRLGTVTIGAVTIDLGGSTYFPALTRGRPTFRPELLPTALAYVAECAALSRQANANLPLFIALSQGATPQGAEVDLEEPFTASLWHNLCALSSALKIDCHPEAEASARRLLGLGGGLTPAGDDALAGFMLALHFATAAQHGGEQEKLVLTALCERMISPRRTATTIFSQEMLRFAALGYFTDVAEDLLLAILAGKKEELAPLVRRQLSIGASSGADQLLGMLVGLSTPFVYLRFLCRPFDVIAFPW